jgi:hypothetical protein
MISWLAWDRTNETIEMMWLHHSWEKWSLLIVSGLHLYRYSRFRQQKFTRNTFIQQSIYEAIIVIQSFFIRFARSIWQEYHHFSVKWKREIESNLEIICWLHTWKNTWPWYGKPVRIHSSVLHQVDIFLSVKVGFVSFFIVFQSNRNFYLGKNLSLPQFWQQNTRELELRVFRS